ncbi:probable calcium-binding protein CML35 [Ananas comosus]|uniref:Probable calcium-binding protein CML35 n=1 Tax=Ananas comosus TaxID=4615 RepID=A0A199VYJ1_ANACO|nr:probable calcium-binding protein CML35 [Ananas comosus]OAY82036.1 putative calcium-binding protein [Ananas comosus]
MKISIASFFGSSKKHFFPKQKGSRSISRSDTATSLSSSSSSDESSSSSSDTSHRLRSTPKSILPPAKSNTRSEPAVSPRELAAALRRLGLDPPSEEEVAALAAAIGAPGGDLGLLLGFGEASAAAPAPAAEEEELRGAFAVFDADGDGMITAEELRGVLVALGDEDCSVEECRRMIGGADANGDGVVCFDDFLRLMDARR